MIEQFKESIRWMADAAVGAPDCEPPHMHVDEFLDPERWTDEQIVLLLRAVKTIQVVGKCPIVAIEEIQLPCGTPVPDSLVAIADLWRGVQETPPAIYVMNEGDVPSGGEGLLLPRATRELSETVSFF